ncbi:hypothetical protein Dfri01_68860 [Dyadobacter frigoris]|uniref:hypothetical protein n=1 Tax=Dyadobacter frigoris TaxID=2576211 RepID=UPI0024A1B293|nr:hypothetical protein [Dyadobacter frigoris]GLU57425.1 hypothetical protein Dfri01_68860 [Dyadobacter frigoris]
MNDSGFELSGIRQLLLQITGIDILSIQEVEKNPTSQTDDALVSIIFTSISYPGKKNQRTMSLQELNKLCEKDLYNFKDHFERFLSNQVD